MNPPRLCAICSERIAFKERLCDTHKEEYEDQLTEPWLCAIIEYSNYEYNILRREIRNHVESLDQIRNI